MFKSEAWGKWILAGEHAVLRGSPALVFPVKKFSMKFHFEESDKPLKAHFRGTCGEELNLVFWGLVESALQRSGRKRSDLCGNLIVESTLPLGAGLGASAALCVGVAKCFAHLKWIEGAQVYEFARDLEGLFHGESSGVDIAVALEGQGLRFMRGGERVPVKPKWWPKLYLSYSGKRGVTADCVNKVAALWKTSESRGQEIDLQMRQSVELAEKALGLPEAEGLPELVKALDLGRQCFYQWSLCDGELDQHLQELTQAGALSVKPTGSGGGGYALSLWKNEPPPEWKEKLIQL